MAQQVVVEMVDDLDGIAGDDVTTVQFALDGRSFEIDLSADNAENLRSLLAEFVEAGRRLRGDRAARRTRGVTTDQGARQRAHAIREWAQQAGHQLSERGRIPAHVVEAYDAAQQDDGGQPDNDPRLEAAADNDAEASGNSAPANLPSFSG